MYSETEAIVLNIAYEDKDIQHLHTDKGIGRALLYKKITRPAEQGDRVIINTTATHLRLGTGGWDIVRNVLTSSPTWYENTRGHVMKARYTPVQHSVLSIEAEESPYHQQFQRKFSLDGYPILLAELHSMIPLIYYLTHEIKASLTCCFIFDDQAALPLIMSEHLRSLKKEESLTTITVGQAFGGDFEAINIVTALQFAKETIKADIIVISVGPGVVGTGTYYGFSGMVIADWSHYVSALNGLPIWIPRISFADRRSNHYGLSHHTLTPLSQFTFKKAILPFPAMDFKEVNLIKSQLAETTFQVDHDIRFSDRDNMSTYVRRALRKASYPIQTMGRSFNDDPQFFLAVAEALRITLFEASIYEL